MKVSIIALVVTALIGCGVQEANTSNTSEILPFIVQPIVKDATYDVRTDEAVVTVQYTGGCKEHTFELVIDPACRETFPVQCSSRVIQITGHDDHCEAIIAEEVRFSLTDRIVHPAVLFISGAHESGKTIHVMNPYR